MSESDEDRRARLARERLEAIQKAKKDGTLGAPRSTPAPKPESAPAPRTRERRYGPSGQTEREITDRAVRGDNELSNKIRNIDREYSR